MTTQEYEEIAHRMRPRLMQLGRSFFHDEELAEDAVQEALFRLWLLRNKLGTRSSSFANEADGNNRAPGGGEDRAPKEALLVRLMKNVCVSEWRRQQKHETMSVEIMGGVLSEETQPMADDDNQRMLQQAIRSLSPQEQRLFRMRHELGMDVPQIAAATGMLARSVSHVVSVARHKIVEQLKKEGIL